MQAAHRETKPRRVTACLLDIIADPGWAKEFDSRLINNLLGFPSPPATLQPCPVEWMLAMMK
jgi:hypothetical protein